MNTCEELIKKIEAMTGHKPIVTPNLRPDMVPAEGSEWIKKSNVLTAIKETCNVS